MSRRSTQLSNSELSKLTVKMVKYLLNNSISKLGIKQTNLIAAVGCNTATFTPIFENAKEALREVYGFNVIEVPKITPRQFICVSLLDSATKLEYTSKERRIITLQFTVLSYIFMKGGSVSEEAIVKFLKRMGINIDEPHDYFGDDIKKLITETMPKQFYLLREKEVMEGINEEKITFSWGFRSTFEFPKLEVLDAVSEILLKPSFSFVQQYDEAHPEDIEMDVV